MITLAVFLLGRGHSDALSPRWITPIVTLSYAPRPWLNQRAIIVTFQPIENEGFFKVIVIGLYTGKSGRSSIVKMVQDSDVIITDN